MICGARLVGRLRWIDKQHGRGRGQSDGLCCFSHGLSFGIHHLVSHHNLLFRASHVVHHYRHVHLLSFSHNVCSPVSHMYLFGLHEPHMSVDAAATIPSAVGLVAVVHTHSHHILPSKLQMRRKVIPE